MAGRIDEYDRAEERDRFGTDPDRADTAAIRADIRETRDRMSHTLDGIGDRLNPDHIKQQVKDNLREATIGRAETMARHAADRVTETRRGIADTLRDNPIPAAMVGIGLGWLLFNGKREEHYDGDRQYGREMGYWTGYEDRARTSGTARQYGGMYDQPGSMDRAGDWASDTAEGVADRAQNLAGQAQETVSDFADRTRESAAHLAERATDVIEDQAHRARVGAEHLAQQTRYQAHRLEDRFHDAVVDSPLVVGAAAIALGLTAGLAIPTTRREAELMGPTRDRMLERARDMAEETGEKVQNVAQRVATRVSEEAETATKEAAREEGLMGGDQQKSQQSGGMGASGRQGAFGGGTSTGTGQSGTGQSGTGQSGTGQSGTGQSGTGAFRSGGTGPGSAGSTPL